jgi:TPR repeat protein
MSVKHSRSIWVGVFVLNLLSSVALADSATSTVPAASVTPADPKKLVEQAEMALDREELDKAADLFHQAAELNYTPAQVALGNLASSAQEPEQAVGWYLMAATQGDAAGQYNLAQAYLTGFGIEMDPTKAVYWMRRSAAKNYLPAAQIIAGAYRVGGFSGVVQVDLDQANSWDAKVLRLQAAERKKIQEREAEHAAILKKMQEEEDAKKK